MEKTAGFSALFALQLAGSQSYLFPTGMARSDRALDKGMALFLVKTVLIAILAADSRKIQLQKFSRHLIELDNCFLLS
jgi:hypothetical protein